MMMMMMMIVIIIITKLFEISTVFLHYHSFLLSTILMFPFSLTSVPLTLSLSSPCLLLLSPFLHPYSLRPPSHPFLPSLSLTLLPFSLLSFTHITYPNPLSYFFYPLCPTNARTIIDFAISPEPFWYSSTLYNVTIYYPQKNVSFHRTTKFFGHIKRPLGRLKAMFTKFSHCFSINVWV